MAHQGFSCCIGSWAGLGLSGYSLVIILVWNGIGHVVRPPIQVRVQLRQCLLGMDCCALGQPNLHRIRSDRPLSPSAPLPSDPYICVPGCTAHGKASNAACTYGCSFKRQKKKTGNHPEVITFSKSGVKPLALFELVLSACLGLHINSRTPTFVAPTGVKINMHTYFMWGGGNTGDCPIECVSTSSHP